MSALSWREERRARFSQNALMLTAIAAALVFVAASDGDALTGRNVATGEKTILRRTRFGIWRRVMTASGEVQPTAPARADSGSGA